MVKKKRSKADRGPSTGNEPTQRKLSEVVLEMGSIILKDPKAESSFEAAQTLVLLASSAWNAALGYRGCLDRLPELLGQIDFSQRQPWPELISTETDLLIADLIAYKLKHHPGDRRRIAETLVRSDGKLRVSYEAGNNIVAGPFGSRAIEAEGTERPIAAKFIARMKQATRGRLLDFRKVLEARDRAKDLLPGVATKEELADLHPLHAAYVLAQNLASAMLEQLTALPGLEPFKKILTRAQDIYMPSGPPMSPLTVSFYSCWALFDVSAGPARETIGTTILEVGRVFGLDPEYLRLIRLFQESRMGIFVVERSEKTHVQLSELVTGASCRALVPSGHRGKRGELWYVRVLPPAFPGGSDHLVFTTPYVLIHPDRSHWEAYFQRTLPEAPSRARIDGYAQHMKFGADPWYWTEFVFEAYGNYTSQAVQLVGLPDIPESRPHSRVNRYRDFSS